MTDETLFWLFSPWEKTKTDEPLSKKGKGRGFQCGEERKTSLTGRETNHHYFH